MGQEADAGCAAEAHAACQHQHRGEYYIDLDADEMAAGPWRGFGGGEGTVLGTAEPEEAKKAEEGSVGCSTEPSSMVSIYGSGGRGLEATSEVACPTTT